MWRTATTIKATQIFIFSIVGLVQSVKAPHLQHKKHKNQIITKDKACNFCAINPNKRNCKKYFQSLHHWSAKQMFWKSWIIDSLQMSHNAFLAVFFTHITLNMLIYSGHTWHYDQLKGK